MKNLIIAAMSLTLLAGCGTAPMGAAIAPSAGYQGTAKSASLDNALIDATDASDLAKIKDLLAKGANVDARDQDKNTPLFYAVGREKVEIAQFLISKGANVNAQGYRQQTPLYNAVGRMNVDLVKLLLDHGARPDAVTQSGWTIMDNVSQSGGKKRKQIIAMLEEALAKLGKDSKAVRR
jgi:ankyrin repeat protein